MFGFSWRQLGREGRLTWLLALPLIAGQVGQMLIGWADTLMLGWYGEAELAACAFANNLVYLPLMLGVGMAVAVSIRVSTARGARRPEAARAALRQGMWIMVAMGLLTMGYAAILLPLFGWFGQDAEVIAVIDGYWWLLAASMVPMLMGFALKNHADAMDRPWPVFWISMAGVALNVVLNWWFIFGGWGMAEMGLVGAGWATLIARTLTLVGMWVWAECDGRIADWVPNRWLRMPDWGSVLDLVRTGWPVSLQMLAEVSVFVLSAMLIGTLGKVALGAHQVTLMCAATVFMMPLGISMAVTVRVGEAVGEGRREVLRPILISAWAMGAGLMLLSGLLFWFGNEWMAASFAKSVQVRELVQVLLLVAAAFQLADSFQVIAAGALRGVDDVRRPALIAFLVYGVLALPFGALLCFVLGWGAVGMWWGITFGLTMTAVIFGRRAWRLLAA